MKGAPDTEPNIQEIARDDERKLTLLVEAPANPRNFLEYNRTCDTVNQRFLSQPINEADYDSETQACVDLLDPNGKTSFYDHFVNKPMKKALYPGLGLEEPVLPWTRAPPPPSSLPSRGPSDPESSEGGEPRSEQCDSTISSNTSGACMEYLSVPTEKGVPLLRCTDGGHALLDNPEIRRLATGALPPPS